MAKNISIEEFLGEDDLKVPEQQSLPSEYAETFARGFTRSTPYVGGFSDELEGAAKAALEALKQKDYKKFFSEKERLTEEARKRDIELSGKNPTLYGAGAATQLLMPYGAAAKLPGIAGKVGSALFPTGTLGKMLGGGAQAATYELGRLPETGGINEEGGISPQGAEHLTNAALTGSAMAGLSKLPSEGALRTSQRAILGPDTKTMEYYLNNSEDVNKSIPYRDLSQLAETDFGNLTKKVKEGSGKAFDILKESGYKFNLRNGIKRIDQAIKEIEESGNTGAGSRAALAELRAQKNDLIKNFEPPKQPLKDPDFIDYLNKQQGRGPVERRTNTRIPIEKLKPFVQGLDESINYETPFGEVGNKAIKGVRGDINQMLRKLPDRVDKDKVSYPYAEQMDIVAPDTAARSAMVEQFGKDPRQQMENAFRASMSKRGVPLEKEQALAEMEKRLGKDDSYMKRAKDYSVAETFSGGDVQGSRKVNFAKTLGQLFDKKLGTEGGESAGAIAGMFGDRGGPAVTKKLLDLEIFLKKTPVVRTALKLAGQKGYKNFIVTDKILRENYPEYDRIMTPPQDENISIEDFVP